MEDMNQVEVKTLNVGDVVEVQVAAVESKQVVVHIDGVKQVGIVPISALSSLHIETSADAVQVGDRFEVQITKVEDEAIIASKRLVDAARAWEELERKYEEKTVFDVVVKDIVKGGLVVDLGVRGFIPASLVEAHFVEDFEDYRGRTLACQVVELDKEKNRVILSHRAVVETEKKNAKQTRLEQIEAGQVLDGKVQRITDFGVFVDLGGLDGLVHISQLSHQHVDKPTDVVTEGQDVKVKVLSVDRNNERIALSIKDTLPGPWAEVAGKVTKGAVVEGVVKRLVTYGAFIELFPRVEGLVHISQISHKHISTPNEVLKEGQVVQAKVLDVNVDEHRISLSIKELQEVEVEEDFSEYKPQETSGFSFGEVLGEQLNKFKR